MRRRLTNALALAGLLALFGPGSALNAQREKPVTPKFPEHVQRAERQLREVLDQKNVRPDGVLWIGAPELKKLFPGTEFFTVRFRIFPVARDIPEGYKPSNLVAVTKDGKVQRLPDEKALETFFAKGPTVRDEATAKQALKAWLRLSQEFLQDGFYQFEIIDEGITAADEGRRASGRALVKQGGNGELSATLTFGETGKLAEAKTISKIQEGPRPICQATKLLDPDPIVRRMAERDLLIMGTAAGDYLREQRAKADPALRQAIDRLWQQILDAGW